MTAVHLRSQFVAYEPPVVSRTIQWPVEGWQGRVLVLSRGPRLIRAARGDRWHRARAGFIEGDTYIWSWCGNIRTAITVGRGDFTANELPPGDRLCGTCEGRAVGAGHPPTDTPLHEALLYKPRSSRPAPSWCPLSEQGYLDAASELCGDRRRIQCPACDAEVRIVRSRGSWGGLRVAPHSTGPNLVRPCPFHRWSRLKVYRDLSCFCVCGWLRPQELAVAA